jgi:hypothetical protein
MNPNPSAHLPAMKKLVAIGKPAIKRILRAATLIEHLPGNMVATLDKPTYRTALQRISTESAVRDLSGYLEQISEEIKKRQSQRQRIGEVLAMIGIDAWDMMMQTVAQHPRSGYTRTVYYLMPQFVHRLPVEYFGNTALNHPVEAIRAKATLCIQQYENSDDFLLQIGAKNGGVLKQEYRYQDDLNLAFRKAGEIDEIGRRALLTFWYSKDPKVRQVAVIRTIYLKNLGNLDFFIKAVRESEPEIVMGGLLGLRSFSSHDLKDRESQVIEVLLEVVELATSPQQRGMALTTLASLKGFSQLEPMMRYLEAQDDEMQLVGFHALSLLLERLSSKDKAKLKNLLLELLQQDAEFDIHEAVLYALAKLGDAPTVAAINEFAKRMSAKPNEDSQELLEVAQRVLEEMQKDNDVS